MKGKDIEAAIANGTPLAHRPKPRETTARVLTDLHRWGSGWRGTMTRRSGFGYQAEVQSSRIVTLAEAEAECASNEAEAAAEHERAQLAYSQRISLHKSAVAACKLIEAHAPSARVDAGCVVLSPEDATKLACIAHASAELDKALAERNGAPS